MEGGDKEGMGKEREQGGWGRRGSMEGERR